jgi:hypothetical protein
MEFMVTIKFNFIKQYYCGVMTSLDSWQQFETVTNSVHWLVSSLSPIFDISLLKHKAICANKFN